MAALTTVTASRSGVSVAGTAVGASDTFTNTGGEVIIVYNGSGAPITCTVTTTATVDGQAVGDLAVTVAASARTAIGPFPRYVYGATTTVVCSATTSVTIAVLKVTPATT